MEQYIPKSALVAEIKKLKYVIMPYPTMAEKVAYRDGIEDAVKIVIKSLEVKDPYEQCVQYDSIKAGIQAHAEDYSFNIESELFNQLTKEQQALWRKEIEEACISGGYAGYQLAKDPRYKENLEVKEVDLEKEFKEQVDDCWVDEWSYDVSNWIRDRRGTTGMMVDDVKTIAKHFFELGLKAQRKSISIQNVDDVLKESGVDPDSKGAKMFKESYYAAIDKLLEQKRK